MWAWKTALSGGSGDADALETGGEQTEQNTLEHQKKWISNNETQIGLCLACDYQLGEQGEAGSLSEISFVPS